MVTLRYCYMIFRQVCHLFIYIHTFLSITQDSRRLGRREDGFTIYDLRSFSKISESKLFDKNFSNRKS